MSDDGGAWSTVGKIVLKVVVLLIICTLVYFVGKALIKSVAYLFSKLF